LSYYCTISIAGLSRHWKRNYLKKINYIKGSFAKLQLSNITHAYITGSDNYSDHVMGHFRNSIQRVTKK
jgi:hypothetical protein